VENIAGASGNIGTCQVAKAAPDGYTILFAFSSNVVNPTLFARVPYDPIKDFDPVTLAVASTTALTVNPSVPAKTVKELIDLIKANCLDLVHVPFGGGGPAVAAVVAGHTPISFGSAQAAMPHGREGTVSCGHQQEALADLPRRQLHEARIDAAKGAGITQRHGRDQILLEPLDRPGIGERVHLGRVDAGVDRARHQRHAAGLRGITG